MIWIVAALYVLAAVLPIYGLARVLRIAHREPSGENPYMDPALDIVQVAEMFGKDVREDAKADAKFNLGVIGVGLALGAIASIWSLFL